MEIGAGGYGHFDMKLDQQDMLKNKVMTETVNKSLSKDGKALSQTLDKEDFLKLLVTQMQNQDPANPMQDREFIAQMAQFSSLEQMLNMNKGMDRLVNNMSFQNSFDLLGKSVTVNNEAAINGKDAVVNGMVESVSKSGDEVMVRVNGRQYPLANVVSVE